MQVSNAHVERGKTINEYPFELASSVYGITDALYVWRNLGDRKYESLQP